MKNSETIGTLLVSDSEWQKAWAYTLLIAEILSGKNARAWVSMDFK